MKRKEVIRRTIRSTNVFPQCTYSSRPAILPLGMASM
jgi:hypothetical protein